MPDEVGVWEDHLLTPFPLFIESPLLNPSISHEHIIKELLDHASKLDPEDLKMVEEILKQSPDILNE